VTLPTRSTRATRLAPPRRWASARAIRAQAPGLGSLLGTGSNSLSALDSTLIAKNVTAGMDLAKDATSSLPDFSSLLGSNTAANDNTAASASGGGNIASQATQATSALSSVGSALGLLGNKSTQTTSGLGGSPTGSPAFSSIAGGGSGGGGGGIGGLLGMGLSFLADGGKVTGPGTSRSDSILPCSVTASSW
jgi:hypothetical protein